MVVSRLVRHIAVQAWRQITAGDEPQLEGNVRSFWYRWVKPVLMRLPPEKRPQQVPDRLVSGVLASLIEGRRLLSYADFGFTDENWRNRGIGALRPQVLVFAEKAGQLRLLLRLHKRFGVSFVALGGLPSACTSEFTVLQLTPVLQGAPVHLIGLVDHDPWGEIVASSFVDQLTSFGLKPASVRLLVTPDRFTDKELLRSRVPLSDNSRTAGWLAGGGGIDGQAWGLSVDSLPVQRLQQAAEEVIVELAADPVAGDEITVQLDDLGAGTAGLVRGGRRVVVVDKSGAVGGVLDASNSAA